jgi:hypothetical protein
MPKNTVTDPITDQEMAFAHLVMSGSINDREAAEAAGLNPNTAAYTKSKPRVREYMDNHREAVKKQLIAEESEGLRRLNLGRDQILARLWELANLPPDATKGSIGGQMKAMAMIVAIEGLLPGTRNDRRPSPAAGQPATPPVKPDIYVSEWLRQRQDQATEPEELVTAAETQPTAPDVPETPPKPANHPLSAGDQQNHTTPGTPSTYPKGVSWVPNAIGPPINAYINRGRGRFSPGR